MNIRYFIGVACTFSLFACGVSSRKSNPKAAKPNIIFLLADDMRFDALGCNGNSLAVTPNLDRLAAEGTNFKRAYVTTAICAISRASFLSGQYERRHGIDDFSKTFSPLALQQTYPLLMRANGYYTGFIGKYGVGNVMPVNAFDIWKGFPGHGSYFYKQPDGTLLHETAMMGKQMKEFIKNRDQSKPFCLSVSFKAPHSEDGIKENNGFRPDPYFDNWFTDTDFPYPATYPDSFYYRFSPFWRTDSSHKENEARVRFRMRFSTAEKYQTSVKAIYKLVSGIDKVVGELRNFLIQEGLSKNTILVFASDNGYYMGEHGLEGKWYGHEESIHVPLIVYNPLLRNQRRTVDKMVLNIDFAPAFLQWAGLQVPVTMQGRSFSGLLQYKDLKWRTDFFYEHRYNPGTYPVYIPNTVGIVTDTLKYMVYYNGSKSSNMIYEELFWRKNDPFEKNNLAQDKQFSNQKLIFLKKINEYETVLK